ncbi:uncharacterized protein LOC114948459 [Acropora millepora]|uniref:uncharacterized protein LOC114948459 n=1 Tax=Acropora millepora TaxID=45264 RepID=UPI0010FCA440|nr:uncharacterized protein LOC114948459 [Acropora millepora]XP_029180846.1 uncharacterized protein LOC114948459 [Acropora millepora]XP_029180853.1 uncharacterized protein LOC114948459 [Acropora millepora]XP_029180868.1 uncharacterized protein LOC114948459 [Acropora millepora]XP_029180871.1 uncharacterized protein LOC114948459 [Acropora millepora]XP_029180875.1 uncharacterized protein LOC114948459 [Acropora millepora]XP_044174976.1 uncharacterized protein LOC114948459 [Acropora millepora]XP_0
MREAPMNNSENNLLPKRRTMSPPLLTNLQAHTTKQTAGGKESMDPASRKERLFSASSRTSSSSPKYEPSLSEKCITPPFTPHLELSNERENLTKNFHLRRPSEHFLEVLGAQKTGHSALSKTKSGTSLPPLQKRNDGEELVNLSSGEVKIAFSESVCSVGSSKQRNDDNQILFLSGTKKPFVEPNHTNGKILRKTNSLPLIKTSSNQTNGLSFLSGSLHRNRTNSAVVRPQGVLDEPQTVPLPFDENLEDEKEDAEILDEREEEQDLAKFSMICQWLKDCEKAKIT